MRCSDDKLFADDRASTTCYPTATLIHLNVGLVGELVLRCVVSVDDLQIRIIVVVVFGDRRQFEEVDFFCGQQDNE